MKYVDEYRDPAIIHGIAAEIARIAGDRSFRIMEVCGGHTHSIYRFGLASLLPKGIEFIHGPGCPVCVLPMGRVDEGLAIAHDPRVIFTAFGDMMRVPGRNGSALEHKARGADVRMIYSPMDALALAQKNPEREVVFFAIGFETTTPSTALTVLRAHALGVTNFSVFCNHILVPPAVRAVLDSGDVAIDGFIGPGHVATVAGADAYEFIAAEYHRPVVVSGFEPVDLLQSTLMVVTQLVNGEAKLENEYGRFAPAKANAAATAAMDRVFAIRDEFEWRGLGMLPNSALRISPEFAAFDAEAKFATTSMASDDHPEAQCGDVLRGLIKPPACRLFGTVCTPEHPIGALMVSSEGSCAAHFKYVMQPAYAEA
jgi:hydrogenase expression/formation protein HypD